MAEKIAQIHPLKKVGPSHIPFGGPYDWYRRPDNGQLILLKREEDDA